MKRVLFFLLLSVFSYTLMAQSAGPSKKCPTCGVSLGKCKYKGKHPKPTKPQTPVRTTPSKPVVQQSTQAKSTTRNSSSHKQDNRRKESDEDEIYETVDQNPSFPGGDKALWEWLSKNLRYPASAQKNNIQGRVLVQFVVGKDGSIDEPRILRSIDPELDAEAIRVVSAMPKWIPGKVDGKYVRVRLTLPIMFRLS